MFSATIECNYPISGQPEGVPGQPQKMASAVLHLIPEHLRRPYEEDGPTYSPVQRTEEPEQPTWVVEEPSNTDAPILYAKGWRIPKSPTLPEDFDPFS